MKGIEMAEEDLEVCYNSQKGFFIPEEGDEPTHRCNPVKFGEYLALITALAAAEVQLLTECETPVYVTPDQEQAIRSIARDDAWIIVRGIADAPPPVAEVTNDLSADVATVPSSPEVDPAQEWRKILRQPCLERGGLPHALLRYVLTDEPGRIDGLCQCGLRIPWVPCPHQHQQLRNKKPTCADCGKILVGGAGFVDNRSADGKPDPNVRLAVGAASDGKDSPHAYRA
jgi:hypothetical protein